MFTTLSVDAEKKVDLPTFALPIKPMSN